jgi:hypothetical protein
MKLAEELYGVKHAKIKTWTATPSLLPEPATDVVAMRPVLLPSPSLPHLRHRAKSTVTTSPTTPSPPREPERRAEVVSMPVRPFMEPPWMRSAARNMRWRPLSTVEQPDGAPVPLVLQRTEEGAATPLRQGVTIVAPPPVGCWWGARSAVP